MKSKDLIKAKDLKALLQNECISQTELARMLGIADRTVRRYIAGDLPMPRMFQLAVIYILEHDDVLVDQFIGRTSNQNGRQS
jgi:transcriptional regulator with XRE-family HTH domain